MELSLISALRAETGAGIVDIKKALEESGGNKEKAIEFLRKSGALKAAKKADRLTGQGIIDAYVHANGKVAVLIELACETDFVARNEQFRALAHDLAMHIAAHAPLYISSDQIPAEVIAKERAVFEEEMRDKPQEIAGKIAEEKLTQYYNGVCLLDQTFIKNDSITVRTHVESSILALGENIVIKRFCRFAMNASTTVCE